MAAKTPAQRKADQRKQERAQGLKEVRGLMANDVTKAVWQSCATAAGLPLNQWLEGAANAQARKEMRKGK